MKFLHDKHYLTKFSTLQNIFENHYGGFIVHAILFGKCLYRTNFSLMPKRFCEMEVSLYNISEIKITL